MDTVAESGRKPVSKYQPIRFSLSVENSGLTRDATADSILRGQILRREREQHETYIFPYSAYLEQDWQPCPVDPYSAERKC